MPSYDISVPIIAPRPPQNPIPFVASNRYRPTFQEPTQENGLSLLTLEPAIGHIGIKALDQYYASGLGRAITKREGNFMCHVCRQELQIT